MNVCSYHLQEAGATPVQEIAYALATADRRARRRARVGPGRAPTASPPSSARSRSSSTPASASSRRPARCGPSPSMWDRICAERYGVADPKPRRFRYGVQVNCLGLTEAQPENNVQRIVLEMLGVTLSKGARARSHPAPGVERGARAAPAVGPAVVAADATGAGLRDRPARVRRHLRRLQGRRGQDRRAGRGGHGRARRRARPRRRLRGHRRAEGPARAVAGRADPAHRVGRADGRRRQPVHRDRTVAARPAESILRVDPGWRPS